MGRKSLENQMKYIIFKKAEDGIGHSKHEEKQERIELGIYQFKEGLENIYSYSTEHKYLQVLQDYNKYMLGRGVNKYTELSKTEEYAKEYLQERLEKGYSIYSLKSERAALGKIYGHTIDINLPARNTQEITRSREKVENDKHFSVDRNKDAITIASAIGTRRTDLEKIRITDFFYRTIKGKEYLFVSIDKSKGGRNRISLVRPDKQREVEKIIEDRRANNQEKLCSKVHSAMDVHSYRRDYARELYKQLADNRDLRERVLEMYPERSENVQSDVYKSRKTKEEFDRDSAYLISQCLGHNRLSVSVNHYLI